MTRVYVPRDAAALSVGAEDVANAIQREAAARELDVTLIRNGSRGLFWLEPLVEVETAAGRIAYGPVTEEDVPAILDFAFPISDCRTDPKSKIQNPKLAQPSPLCLGPTEEISYL